MDYWKVYENVAGVLWMNGRWRVHVSRNVTIRVYVENSIYNCTA